MRTARRVTLNFFTTDPFALSAAVILDTGMPDVALQKVNQTFAALEGAFSQFDEVSLYTYSTSVTKVTDFAAVGRRLTAALDGLKTVTGQQQRASRGQRPDGTAGAYYQRRPGRCRRASDYQPAQRSSRAE